MTELSKEPETKSLSFQESSSCDVPESNKTFAHQWIAPIKTDLLLKKSNSHLSDTLYDTSASEKTNVLQQLQSMISSINIASIGSLGFSENVCSENSPIHIIQIDVSPSTNESYDTSKQKQLKKYSLFCQSSDIKGDFTHSSCLTNRTHGVRELIYGSSISAWKFNTDDDPNLLIIGGIKCSSERLLCVEDCGDRFVLGFNYNSKSYSTVGVLHFGRIYPASVCISNTPIIAIIGGCRNGSSVEFFDPIAGTSRVGIPLIESRFLPAAIPLSPDLNSDILVVGGLTGPWQGAALRSVEIVSPKWATYHTDTVRLQRGRCNRRTIDMSCFSTSMCGDGSQTMRTPPIASLSYDLNDPVKHTSGFLSRWSTKTFYKTHEEPSETIHSRYRRPMRQARASCGIASFKESCWIIVAGGNNGARGLASSELYNSRADYWISGPNLNISRNKPLISILPNALVVIIGGVDYITNSPITSVEIWDAHTFITNQTIGLQPSDRFITIQLSISILQPPYTEIIQIIKKHTQSSRLQKELYQYRQSSLNSSQLYSSQNSQESSQEEYRHQLNHLSHYPFRDENILEAPRTKIHSYFKSKLVEKMKRKKSLTFYT